MTPTPTGVVALCQLPCTPELGDLEGGGAGLSLRWVFGKAAPHPGWACRTASESHSVSSCLTTGLGVGRAGGPACTRGPGRGPGCCHCCADAPSRDRSPRRPCRACPAECGCGGGKWGCLAGAHAMLGGWLPSTESHAGVGGGRLEGDPRSCLQGVPTIPHPGCPHVLCGHWPL